MSPGMRFAGLICGWLLVASASAQEHIKQVVYEQNPSDELRRLTATICDPQARPIPVEKLQPAEQHFVRIMPREFTVDSENQLKPTAVLSTKPYAFVTTPESLVGRPLMQLYMDIGYEAEMILSLPHEQEMVAVVFRLPEGIAKSDVKDGKLPEAWNKQLYVPTWDNTFAIFHNVAERAAIEPNGPPTFTPHRSFFRSETEKAFVLSYPQEGKDRIKQTPYYGLKAIGGSDWVYRRTLEAKLSVMEHFRGDGRTHNEVLYPNDDDSQPVLYEYLCPNLDLSAIHELAVVSLGRLGDDPTK